jgi:YT521-B-like domain
MARMMSPIDYTTSSSVWTQTDKWKGRMDVRWIFVKDIPNSHLRHIRVWNNENKPVTNSRDTQELPPDAGSAMLRIFADFPPKTSVILSNLVSAEMKEEAAATTTTGVEDSRQSLQSVDELGQYNHRMWLSTDRIRMDIHDKVGNPMGLMNYYHVHQDKVINLINNNNRIHH